MRFPGNNREGEIRQPRASGAVAIVATTILLSACTAAVYRADVEAFDTGVARAFDALDGLRAEVQVEATKRLEHDLADRGAIVETSGDCTAVVTEILQADSTCLARWARHRASKGTASVDPPACIEPARDATTGEPMFYEIAELAREEAETCRLGVLEDGSVRPEILAAGDLLRNTDPLGAELRAYARSLVRLTASQDTDRLISAIGDSRAAILGLGERLETISAGGSDNRQTAGPLVDLVGAIVLAAFESRRYSALRSVVVEADPVIARAARILSRNAMPLMIPKLREKGSRYRDAVDAFRADLRGEAWIRALADARQAREAYLGLYFAHPAATFRAMAEAHATLAKAVSDPGMQIEALKASVGRFVDVATAAKQLFGILRPDRKATDAEATPKQHEAGS